MDGASLPKPLLLDLGARSREIRAQLVSWDLAAQLPPPRALKGAGPAEFCPATAREHRRHRGQAGEVAIPASRVSLLLPGPQLDLE